MKVLHTLEELEFGENTPNARPLFVSANARVMRFALRPGQKIGEHSAPSGGPLYIVVLKGNGVFSGGDGKEQTCGPNALLVFEPGERHAVRALEEELVFLAFLQGVPGARKG